MPKKLTVEDVIDRLQAKIDMMELRMFNKGLNLLISDQDEYEAKIAAFEEAISLLQKIK